MNSLKEQFFKNTHTTEDQIGRLLAIQKKKGLSLRKILVDEGVLSEDSLVSLFSGRFYMPAVSLSNFKFDRGLIDLFPEYISRIYSAVPLFKTPNTLVVATSEPLNILALDDLKDFCRCNVALVLSNQNEIAFAIEGLYGKGNDDKYNKADAPVPYKMISGPVDKLVDILLAHALKKRASDIHIEPELDCLRIRYRVDGLLQDVLKAPKINQNPILARLKMISGIDISENRIPQDGKFKVKSGGQEFEFRVSSLPTAFGQKFVLHIVDKRILYEGLRELGFSEANTRNIESASAKLSGLILIGGPVGSGKTTTLYSILNQLNSSAKHIVTIEDPVEYRLGGITQVQARPDAGLDFSSGLRSIIRQNPDVIMIDQLRDSESAEAAVKAALSGKLVLSTVQSEGAISGISRLIEMGVEPFLAASSLIMICSQRLARKNCLKCRKPVDAPKDLSEKAGLHGKARFYAAKGCDYCNHTGFFGRVAVSETLLIDDAIRDIIINRKPYEEIRKYALKRLEFKSLRDDAFLKAGEGLISFDEALRVSSEE